MIICNLLARAIARYAIQKPGGGPEFPVDKPALFRNFNIPELLATMSFGHILVTGVILGLANDGVLWRNYRNLYGMARAALVSSRISLTFYNL